MEDSCFLIVLSSAALLYLIFHYFCGVEFWQPRLERAHKRNRAQEMSIWLQRIGGSVVLGLCPMAVLVFISKKNLEDYGLRLTQQREGVLVIVGVMVIVTPLLYWGAKSKRNWDVYPVLRTPAWTWVVFFKNHLTWFIYLCAYEFFFRGYLLFSAHAHLDAWTSIWLTTLVYTCVHLPKNAFETFGCIPIGLLFGWVTLETGSILPAALAHFWIASANDVIVFYANPQFKFCGRSK